MVYTKLHKREILEKIIPNINLHHVLLIIGSRQVGKTSLLKLIENELINAGVKHSQIIYFDLENPILRENFELKNYDLIAKYLKNKTEYKNDKIFVLLDEVQYLSNSAGMLKFLHDNYSNFKFIVSGSSSLKIKKIFSDSLVGRKRIFNLHPLNFREFLYFKNKRELLKQLPEFALFNLNFNNLDLRIVPSIHDELLELFGEYIKYGGYPEIALLNNDLQKTETLQDFYSSYLMKDISYLFSIDNIGKFNKLVKVYASRIGGLVNSNEIANTLGISRITVEKYSFLQESTFLLEFIKPYYTNIRKELTKMPKVYLEDIGIRNSILQMFSEQVLQNDGEAAENFVFNQIQKNYYYAERFFWRTKSKQEVDFVLKYNGKLLPIEVKFKSFSNPVIPSGLKSFAKKYDVDFGIVVTKNYYNKLMKNGMSILWLPIYMFN